MKYDKIKATAAAKVLPGVAIEFDEESGQLKRAHLKVGDAYLMIVAGDYSGMSLFVPAAPVLVERWRVTGKIGGLDIQPQLFDNEWAAKGCAEADDGLTVERVEIPELEAS